MTENQVYEQVTRHLATYHPGLLWHWDLSGVNNPSPATGGIYSRLNSRGWQDFMLDEPRMMPGTTTMYYGLRLEVKKPGTKLLRTKDMTKLLQGDTHIRKAGDWWDLHTEEQAAQILQHRIRGYVADFAVGPEDFLEKFHSYLDEACPETANEDGLAF